MLTSDIWCIIYWMLLEFKKVRSLSSWYWRKLLKGENLVCILEDMPGHREHTKSPERYITYGKRKNDSQAWNRGGLSPHAPPAASCDYKWAVLVLLKANPAAYIRPCPFAYSSTWIQQRPCIIPTRFLLACLHIFFSLHIIVISSTM